MEPLVSIIIPVYNSAHFLQKSIEHVLQQSYTNIEIILIDDESTDNSYVVAKQFETKGIHVLKQKNAGAAVARNTGLSVASGDYIQFLDVDDFLSNDKIEKQIAALKNHSGKIAVCNYINFFEEKDLSNLKANDQSSFIYSSDNPSDFLINLWGGNGDSNFIQTNCWLTPRNVIEKAGGWRNYRCPDDDGEFFTRVLLASDGIVYVPGIYNFYRRLPGADKLSQNSSSKYVQNVLLTIDLKFQYLKAFTKSEKLKEAFSKQYLDFAVHNFPQHTILSKIALKRYQDLNVKATLPLLGGKLIEAIKKTFGWKVARYVKYYYGN